MSCCQQVSRAGRKIIDKVPVALYLAEKQSLAKNNYHPVPEEVEWL